MALHVGLKREIDAHVHVLKVHKPYHESDHVMNLALNVLAGGTCLQDLELRRSNESYLDALGAHRIPDPTTAGDFCRRFQESHIEALQAAINEIRLRVWKQQPDEFFEQAIIEADGTLAPTTGEKKEGMDVSYDGQWGYHPLVVSLANTGEPLFLVNRSGNRPSHEGASERFDQAIEIVRRAGFRKILLRGDTDFSQTAHLDRWHGQDVEFVFGYNAVSKLREIADRLTGWRVFRRPAKHTVQTGPRDKRDNVKEQVVHDRDFKNIRLLSESVAEFEHQPVACKHLYRMIALRKDLAVERGEKLLFPDVRYFFYITNRRDLSAEDIVLLANGRCDQENLIAQLKTGVQAMRMPSDTLMSNWAYMVMTALAWSLKAWLALLVPVEPRWRDRHLAERRELLRMEFRSFLNAVIHVPAQVVRTGRKIVVRFLGWTRWLGVLFRGVNALRCQLIC